MTAAEKLIANKGGKVVNDATKFTADCEGYYIAENTVITRIEVNGGNTTDVKAKYITTVATAVKGGILLRPNSIDGHKYFSAITISSGSVYAMYK